jgi:hypothetical protein
MPPISHKDFKPVNPRPKPPPLHPLERVWLRLRRPFRYPKASGPYPGHVCQWERFDADRAGCTLCGALHTCAASMVESQAEFLDSVSNKSNNKAHTPQCPLIATDDGAHVCLITGLCLAEVRTAPTEYVDHVVFERPSTAITDEDDGLYDRVQGVVETFLLSASTTSCLRVEHEKYAAKVRQAFWRALRARKRDRPYQLPDMCSVVAEVVHLEPPPPSLLTDGRAGSARSLIDRSAASIACAIAQIHRMGFRKLCQGNKFQSMVIGMLYMSRTGLRIGSHFHLPALPDIHELLPSETYLHCLGVSNKVICETENEIKLCIRAFAESVVSHQNTPHQSTSHAAPSKASSDPRPRAAAASAPSRRRAPSS